MITIINSETGNFLSVVNMLKKIGYETILTDDYDLISNSKILIFPGVGNFDNVMNKIYEKKIDKAILNSLEKNSKLLGICVGMQALFTKSQEGKIRGLDLIKGEINKFSFEKKILKIPHMGWNKVNFDKDSKFNEILSENRFYFVHSYFAKCDDKKDILGVTNYGVNFASSVRKNNIFGVQFHPEKSHYFGKKFLKTFIEID